MEGAKFNREPRRMWFPGVGLEWAMNLDKNVLLCHPALPPLGKVSFFSPLKFNWVLGGGIIRSFPVLNKLCGAWERVGKDNYKLVRILVSNCFRTDVGIDPAPH